MLLLRTTTFPCFSFFNFSHFLGTSSFIRRIKNYVKKFDSRTDLIFSQRSFHFSNVSFSRHRHRIRPISSFRTEYCFSIDKNIAKVIVKNVLTAIKENTTVIELNPGQGFITKILLEQGVKNIVIYDSLGYNELKEIIQEKQNVSLEQNNILLIKTLRILSGAFVEEINKYKDKELIIIIMCPNRVFFRRMAQIVIFNDKDFIKNVKFFLTVCKSIIDSINLPKSLWFNLSDYGTINCLFTTKYLDVFPRNAFVPPSLSGQDEITYFIEFERRKEPFVPYIDFVDFTHFLRILGTTKYNFVIPTLEKFFCDSGPYLIANGISLTTQVGELNVQELVKLFYLVKQLDGFEEIFSVLNMYKE